MSMANKIINKRNMIICCFGGITVFKMICMCCFSSDYQDVLFFPFVSQFLTGQNNPYEYYHANHMIEAFAYPPFMLYIESVPVGLIRLFSIQNSYLFHFVLKLPIFLFDNLCAYILYRLFPHKIKYILLFYCASPIIIYSAYMHGQLDIIPTAILLAAIYFLTQKSARAEIVSLLLSVTAVLTKQHTIAVIPLLFMFYQKRKGHLRCICALMIFTVIVIMCIAPFWSNGFVQEVLLNKEQSRLMNVYIDYDTLKFIIPIFMVLWLYLRVFYLDRINQELLLNYCGILFAVFLAFVAPMPGWYAWIVPFITIFFMYAGQNRYKHFVLYFLLNASYLLYFFFFHNQGLTDLYFCGISLAYLKINNTTLRNQIFTVMTGILLYVIFQMYHFGIASNSLYKRGNIPLALGIAGDSGSGKSYMLHTLEMVFGKKNILEIEGDGDHKWERGEQMWKYHTHLDPKANYLYRQANDIRMLKQGKSVYRVEYDHTTGNFSTPHKIKPRKIIVVCGLHSLYLPQMRKCLDIKIYMDTEESLRRLWKIKRDTAKRGYSNETIINQIESRRVDSQKYIMPQKEYADMVIHFFDDRLIGQELSPDYMPEISMKLSVSSEIDLESIITDLRNAGIQITQDYEENINRQTVLVDGRACRLDAKCIGEIAAKNIPQIDELTMQKFDTEDLNGIIALFILALMSSRLREEI